MPHPSLEKDRLALLSLELNQAVDVGHVHPNEQQCLDCRTCVLEQPLIPLSLCFHLLTMDLVHLANPHIETSILEDELHRNVGIAT